MSAAAAALQGFKQTKNFRERILGDLALDT